MSWIFVVLLFLVLGIGYFYFLATKLKHKEIVQNHPNVLRYKKAIEKETKKAKDEAKIIFEIAKRLEYDKKYNNYIDSLKYKDHYQGVWAGDNYKKAYSYYNEESLHYKTKKKLLILREYLQGKEDESWRLKYEESQEKHEIEIEKLKIENDRLLQEIKALMPYKDEVHRLGSQIVFWKEIINQESGKKE
jgi:hypothetical protein